MKERKSHFDAFSQKLNIQKWIHWKNFNLPFCVFLNEVQNHWEFFLCNIKQREKQFFCPCEEVLGSFPQSRKKITALIKKRINIPQTMNRPLKKQHFKIKILLFEAEAVCNIVGDVDVGVADQSEKIAQFRPHCCKNSFRVFQQFLFQVLLQFRKLRLNLLLVLLEKLV